MSIILKGIDEKLLVHFLIKYKIRLNKKTNQWSKEFTPVVESIKIDKGRYPSFENIIVGYTLGQWIGHKCRYCGKFLSNYRSKFCEDRHRTYFHRILEIGKTKYNFKLGKNNHLLLIPTLYDFTANKKGEWFQKRNNIERIERKNIEFVINGKRNKATTKSRTI